MKSANDKNRLSVTIITKNEEANIRRCLDSLNWADEIVIVDSGSTDDTLAIAEEYDCRIVTSEWLGFGRTKQLAVDHAMHDWILSVDADETVTPELKESILKIIGEEALEHGYRIRRVSFYLQKRINHSGWSSDYPKRLFNRKYGCFNDKEVHESVQIDGAVGRIEEPLLHFTYPTVESHIQKINRYTSLAAEALYREGKTATLIEALIRAKLKFLKMYIIRAGFLDGKEGFILALNSAYGVFLKYLKLWKLSH